MDNKSSMKRTCHCGSLVTQTPGKGAAKKYCSPECAALVKVAQSVQHQATYYQKTKKAKRRADRQDPTSAYTVRERARDKVRGTGRSSARQAIYNAGDLTPAQWSAIVEAHDDLCHYCDAPAKHLDHVHPISRGGQHTASNVVPACTPCNLSKGSKLISEWVAWNAQ